jgi:transcriptional regulator with XRE-family HTH domain
MEIDLINTDSGFTTPEVCTILKRLYFGRVAFGGGAMSQLRRVRELAGYSQEKLAQVIGLAQAQVSRYEAEPDNVPYGVLRKWVAACGTTLESMDEYLAAHSETLNLGEPYRELDGKLNLLEQFLASAPEVPSDLPELTLTPCKLGDRIQNWRQRPVLVLAGKFDSGKTRIANALLGGSRLPSQFQPTTAIVTFVRHVQQRPKWQREDVWVMRRGFDATRWRDEEHCGRHRIVAGTYDTLKLYGTRESEGERQGAVAALVYVDAPILQACTIVDLPGYSDTQQQADVATSSLTLGDVFIYTSAATGFLDAQDFLQISQLLRTGPELQQRDGPLANYFIVATHANPSISDDALVGLLDKAATRLHSHLKDGILAELSAQEPIGSQVLRDRIFSFWFESHSRREQFEHTLSQLLRDFLPMRVSARVDREISQLKSESRDYYRKLIAGYENALERREDARRELEELGRREPERVARVNVKKTEVSELVERLRDQSREFIVSTIAPQLTAEKIEEFIRRHYSSAEEARKYAVSKLLEDTQSALERNLRTQSAEVQRAIDRFLQDYNEAAVTWDEVGTSSVSIPFDARGAFLGGLASAGSLGALGAWAAAMGNLGGYILVAKAAGLLSALGFGVGSTAAVSFVAAIGGPVTIAVGVAAALFIGVKVLLGDSWQRRLAKRIRTQLEEAQFLAKLRSGADRFWRDTEAAFDSGVNKLESAYSDYLRSLHDLIDTDLSANDSEKRLREVLQRLQALQDFFVGIPWRCSA